MTSPALFIVTRYTVESDWMADFLVQVRKKMADIDCY